MDAVPLHSHLLYWNHLGHRTAVEDGTKGIDTSDKIDISNYLKESKSSKLPVSELKRQALERQYPYPAEQKKWDPYSSKFLTSYAETALNKEKGDPKKDARVYGWGTNHLDNLYLVRYKNKELVEATQIKLNGNEYEIIFEPKEGEYFLIGRFSNQSPLHALTEDSSFYVPFSGLRVGEEHRASFGEVSDFEDNNPNEPDKK